MRRFLPSWTPPWASRKPLTSFYVPLTHCSTSIESQASAPPKRFIPTRKPPLWHRIGSSLVKRSRAFLLASNLFFATFSKARVGGLFRGMMSLKTLQGAF
ncbi:MAG TPA: hypothetical protein DF383_01650 [Deltaproteobacteria bacterium]|nr:hypothetical protein [Deltaproteobacteria bacterium]